MTVAQTFQPVVRALVGPDPPIALRFWDGSTLGDANAATTIVVNSADAIARIAFAPGELGLSRAYVAGDIDCDGDIYDVLALRDRLSARGGVVRPELGMRGWADAIKAARQLGVLRRPPAPPPEEVRLRGRRHTRARDRDAVRHHYDVSNEFYRLVLGETMTYSCAYFRDPAATLDDAQVAKYELVGRKLGLAPGMRLLDIGCGWGGMVMHAARHHGVRAVGVTVSRHQHDLAAKRVAEAGLADRVEVRLQDYREVTDGPFDAVSSIGMFEHVGLARLGEYFGRVHALLRPEGRLLNHAISRPPGPSPFASRSFIERYVFPDGELHEVGSVVSAMQDAGFEVRDVHSLREHYARTLRTWVTNLEARWDDAVALAGPGRARVWRLYMAASALNFEAGRASIHQILGVKPAPTGASGLPSTRTGWADW